MPNKFPSRKQGCGNRRLGYLRRLGTPPKFAIVAKLQDKHLRYSFEARLKMVCECQSSSWLEQMMPIIKNRDAEIVGSEIVWPLFNFLGHQEKSVEDKRSSEFCCGHFELSWMSKTWKMADFKKMSLFWSIFGVKNHVFCHFSRPPGKKFAK